MKEFILLNKETIKKAALPITVAAALLFFWAFGGEKKEEIKESQSAGRDEGAGREYRRR